MAIVYILIRGSIVGLDPYPFLDPANGGYPTVAVYFAGILVLMAIVCGLAVAIGNAAGGGHRRPDAAG